MPRPPLTRRHAHTLAWLPLLALLAGCGDPPATGPVAGTPGHAPLGSPPAPPEVPPELSAGLRAAIEGRIKEGRPRLPQPAREPLQASDVETYLALAPQVQNLAGEAPALARLLEEHGMTPTQWVTLQARVVGAALGSEASGAALGASPADAAVVAPYKDRVLATVRGR